MSAGDIISARILLVDKVAAQEVKKRVKSSFKHRRIPADNGSPAVFAYVPPVDRLLGFPDASTNNARRDLEIISFRFLDENTACFYTGISVVKIPIH